MEECCNLDQLPFYYITDAELEILLYTDPWSYVNDNGTFRDFLCDARNCDAVRNLNFKYVSEDQFNSTFASNKNIEFGLFHINIRSLNCNYIRLYQYLQLLAVRFDVIVMSEIWTTNINFYVNSLPQYTLYYDIPTTSKVGGVGIFVRNDVKHEEIVEYKMTSSASNSIENVWLEITKNHKKYIIGGIYRHPNQQIDNFKLSLETVLNKISTQRCPCLIAGDINIDLVKCDSNRKTADYVDTLLLNNFVPTVIMPTRITPKSATLIDHIYYYEGIKPHEFIKTESGNFYCDLTDHLPNYTLLINNIIGDKVKRPLIRIFSEKNKETFCSMLQSAEWDMVYNQNDTNAAYNNFINIVTDAYEQSFTITRLSRKRLKDKPWITKGLKKSSRIKNNLYRKWLISQSPDDESEYKSYKKIFKKVAQDAATSYYKNMFNTKTNSVKQLWKNLNTICSFKKNDKTKRNVISKLNVDNDYITKPEDISNSMNNYFSTVGSKLVNNLINNNPTFNNNDYKSYCSTSIKDSIFLTPVTRTEVYLLIDKLNISKAAGNDNIGPVLVKTAAPIIVDPLLHIYNLSLLNGIVPDKLKIAKVIPVFKTGDRCKSNNYRPISLLSIFEKVLEKLMYTRLYSFLMEHNVLYKNQFGFRKNHSTVLALVEVLDKIYNKLDNHEVVVGIYLDLQKAFDTVNHEILLYKIYHYGIRGITYNWFVSYLANRHQFTSVDNVHSGLLKVTCGVPQGSVLGPLLFLLYINDIEHAVPGVKLFADDTNLFLSCKDIVSLNLDANACMKRLNEWFLANKLSLNLDKTCYMLFPALKNASKFSLDLNGMKIKYVNSCKYLGVIIDDELLWTAHIDHIYCHLLKYVGIFYKLRNKIPKRVLKNIYFAFVHPYILYGIEIYANTSKTHIDKLEKLNNTLLRILQNETRRCYVVNLYVNYDTLSVTDLHKLRILLFVHKYVHHMDKLPEIYKNYFSFNSEIHSYSTRSASNIHLPRAETSYGQRSVSYEGVNLWNNLPDDLKNITSLSKFKAYLKLYFQGKSYEY